MCSLLFQILSVRFVHYLSRIYVNGAVKAVDGRQEVEFWAIFGHVVGASIVDDYNVKMHLIR